MKKILLLSMLSAFVVSCSNDDDSTQNDQPVDKIFFGYVHQPPGIMLDQDLDNMLTFGYDGNKVTRRDGGYLTVSPNAGFYGKYSPFVYDSLSYVGSRIYLTNKFDDNSGLVMQENLRTYHLNSSGNPEWQSFWWFGQNPTALDTMRYEYQQGKVKRIRRGDPQQHELVSEYFFNSQSNLDSIVTKEYYAGALLPGRTVEIFDGYDNTFNPLKKLWMFPDLYYRSVSKNNYQHYLRMSYDENGNSYTYHEVNYGIPYVDGQIRYDIGW